MNKPWYELRLRNSGMFSVVNEVVHYLYLAENEGFRFFINGRHSCYLDQNYQGDPWNYYFEACFEGEPPSRGVKVLPVGKLIACAKNNIITPRLVDGKCKPLLLPKNRAIPNHLISKFIKLKPEVCKIVDAFSEKHFTNKTVGLHLRGMGRNHGGADRLRAKAGGGQGIDYERYFNAVDKYLEKTPSAKIFACSDSQAVIDYIEQVYGDRVITYTSLRSDFGEMHADHPENVGLRFSPYKLGLDIVVEAYLLARTNYFVHGNSNVANFVVCLNHQLEANYVYKNVGYS